MRDELAECGKRLSGRNLPACLTRFGLICRCNSVDVGWGASLMTLLTAFSLLAGALLCGAVLGLRFKVFILLPTIVILVGVLVVLGDLRGVDPWSLAASAGLATIGIQLGYLCGAGVRYSFPSLQASGPSALRH